MILQALAGYYDRKAADPEAGMAPMGFERKEIPFILEIDQHGKLIQIEDTREGIGIKRQAHSFIVPHGAKKTSGIASNLLWDNAEYVLGIPDGKKLEANKAKGKAEEYLERLRDMHAHFRAGVDSLLGDGVQDAGLVAVLAFLKLIRRQDLEVSATDGSTLSDRFGRYASTFPQWEDIVNTNPNIGFRLQGDRGLVCERPAVVRAVQIRESSKCANPVACLVSGEADEIERVHASIKGIWGAQTSGANIVSFNLDPFNSYGKARGKNAPVGKKVAFAYTTALNHLLRNGSPQRIQVGDTSTVFWAEKPSDFESAVVNIFGEPTKDDPDRNVRAVEQLFKSVHHGRYVADDQHTRFFVLGLAPNAARIAVRFWHVSTVGKLAERILAHFEDLEIIHGPREVAYLPLFRLLVSTASLGKVDNIPPNLAGETLRAILEGRPYPQTLLGAAIRRIKAEQLVNYPRAALIKASINRAIRFSNPDHQEEIKVSLDKQNTHTGYRLGRLFAVLEKIQEEASPGLNATIRDRYYGAASGSPVSVFFTLMKLSKHHLPKLSTGRAVYFERLIGEIMSEIEDFPAHLPIAGQGRFAIGYYHQRQDFFQKKTEDTEESHD